MNRRLQPFVWLAALGLGLSIAVHVCALLGLTSPFRGLGSVLHVGTLVVTLPVLFFARPFLFDARSIFDMRVALDPRLYRYKAYWEMLLRGCPPWMKLLPIVFGVYASIVFLVFVVVSEPGRPASEEAWLRVSSGQCMAFYAFAVAVLRSAVSVAQHEPKRRCTAGHLVLSDIATYCDLCRRPIRPVAERSGVAKIRK